MSKVAIKGANTGSATFTLEAPATDTDRTLLLPDEAGAVVVEQAGNVAYKQSNILGTVSQSGGVPTGAIIERGSNANGEFVKYADGTAICTNDDSLTSGSAGNVSIQLPITLNEFFSASAICRANEFGQGTNAFSLFSLQTARGSSNVSQVSLRVGNPSTGTRIESKSIENLTITAIGRWY